MVLTKEKKRNIIESFQVEPKDTGSASVQIALISNRINYLNEHLKSQKKDFSSRRGLLKLVNQRRRLLNYLKTADENKYKEVIDKLNLRH